MQNFTFPSTMHISFASLVSCFHSLFHHYSYVFIHFRWQITMITSMNACSKDVASDTNLCNQEAIT